MVTALKVTNYLGDVLEIDPFDPESSGFLIADIKGITPLKANINFTSITTSDGGVFNSARIDTRNIVLKLIFFPKPTIEKTRLLSYKFFPIKKDITLEFTTDNRKAEITGYIESNDISIFTKEEFSTVSIICPDPYFYSTSKDGNIDVLFSGIAPKFRFPIPKSSDAPIVDHKKKLLFGNILQSTQKVVTYEGDSEIGAEIILRALGPVGNITFYNYLTNESMYIDASKIATITSSDGIIAGDTITIYTYRGDKHITLLREGVIYNILNSLDRDSVWLQIRRGDNIFGFTASSGSTYLQVEIKTRTIYEGL